VSSCLSQAALRWTKVLCFSTFPLWIPSSCRRKRSTWAVFPIPILFWLTVHRRLESAINFVSHSPYFNPARISPSVLWNQSGHLLIKGSRNTAVFIATGAVAECNLIHGGSAGNAMAPYTVKNISVFLIREEYLRSISCIGTALSQTTMHGPVSSGFMTFSTRKESASRSE